MLRENCVNHEKPRFLATGSGPDLSVNVRRVQIMNTKLCAATGMAKKRATILVVDDEPELRDLIKTCLEIEGFDVITAANGLDGLQRYKEHKDQVQVVVTDLDMPAMNGSDMIREIFGITPAMKVIVASGNEAHLAQTLQRWESTSCLPKPYSARELANAVRSLLEAESEFHRLAG
jgi:CheY-like chemotaxis protein